MKKLLIALLAVFALVAAACGDSDSSSDSSSGGTDGGSGGGRLDVDAVLAADLDNCEEAPTGDPLKIGFAADLGELGGAADVPASVGAEVFADLINCSGGIGDGTPVEVTVRDIQGEPDVVQRASQELLDDGVHAILGPPFGDTGLPLLQTTAGETLVVFVSSTEPDLPDPSVNSYLTAFDDTTQATVAAQYALDQGYTTAVTMSDPSIPYFSTNNPGVFTEVFEAGGGKVLADYTHAIIEDTDFSTQVNDMAALPEKPDVIYHAMLAFQAAILRGQMAAAGLEPVVITTDAFEATGGYAEAEGIDGILHTTHTIVTDGSRIGAFEGAIAAAGRADEIAGGGISFAGLAADAMVNIINAYLDAGSTDRAQIAEAFGALTDSDAVTATYNYAGTNGVPDKPVILHEVVDGAPSLAAELVVE